MSVMARPVFCNTNRRLALTLNHHFCNRCVLLLPVLNFLLVLGRYKRPTQVLHTGTLVASIHSVGACKALHRMQETELGQRPCQLRCVPIWLTLTPACQLPNIPMAAAFDLFVSW